MFFTRKILLSQEPLPAALNDMMQVYCLHQTEDSIQPRLTNATEPLSIPAILLLALQATPSSLVPWVTPPTPAAAPASPALRRFALAFFSVQFYILRWLCASTLPCQGSLKLLQSMTDGSVGLPPAHFDSSGNRFTTVSLVSGTSTSGNGHLVYAHPLIIWLARCR